MLWLQVTSHYGFLLPNYHIFYALSGQITNLQSGSLTFQTAAGLACPWQLPVLLAGTTGAFYNMRLCV
jgi:hypothetical protein